ncbi:AzlC family ABC transporter permease [Allobaculum sp. Allo2]|nr:AzlC family ABC transporter permease [Allobaculum sp. Allo2]UNT93833.1 AzlC family ABC transporter permease [Allobaculum sp. Allo2]
MNENESRRLFLDGMKTSIPIALGYFAVSCAYGMAAIIQGMTVTEAAITSLINLTSAGQFAGTTLICAGASLLSSFSPS